MATVSAFVGGEEESAAPLLGAVVSALEGAAGVGARDKEAVLVCVWRGTGTFLGCLFL